VGIGGGGSARNTVISDEGVPLTGLTSFAPFIEGYPDNTFRGNQSTSREEFVTILYRLLGPDELQKTDWDNQSFSDVAVSRWSYDAIEWAKEAGIIYADEDGNFRPAEMLTRAEMAVMLVKANDWTEIAENTFSDIDEHNDLDYILIAVQAGIFEGYPDGSFRPEGETTRYEMITALVRYLLGGEPTDEMVNDDEITITDVPIDHWAFKYFALAVTGFAGTALR